MKIFSLVFFVFSISSSMLSQEPAKFTVEVPAGTQSVRLTGNFWGWNPLGGPIASDNGDNTFTVTLFAGGGESQSDMEYKWVIVDADNVSNPIIENLIDNARANGCTQKIDAGELNTDSATYANRAFVAAGVDDDKFDIFESCGPYAIDVEYTDLVWSDEFNTEAKIPVDASKWHHQSLVIIPEQGWANEEEQHYTARMDNSFLENGSLNIVAKKEEYTSEDITMQYTSARLNSKFAFTYGRVDVRAKLPSGEGTWPAIWTLGKNIDERGGYWQPQFGAVGWPVCGEIDIMEHGLGDVNHTSSALHTPSSSGNTQNVASQQISDVAANWHIYSMNWSPNQITFLVDDVAYYTYNPTVKNGSTWPFDADQYILLNIAMGGISGTVDPSFTESPMVIDYVRVYQNNGLSTDEFGINTFKVYPNPTNTEINIKSDIEIDRVELYDILGNFILEQSETPNSIKIEDLNSGLYLLNIYSGYNKTVKKVVVR